MVSRIYIWNQLIPNINILTHFDVVNASFKTPYVDFDVPSIFLDAAVQACFIGNLIFIFLSQFLKQQFISKYRL